MRLPAIDHELGHNIVKVAMCGFADYFDNVITESIVYNRTDVRKTDVNLFFTITNCQIAHSC